MKLPIAALVILFGAALATAQKKDPTLLRSHPNKHATSEKSLGPGAVAAALNRKSTTASDLTKVERGPSNHPNESKPATAHTSVPKNFGVGQDNKNKPMHASKHGKVGRSSSHPKTKAS